MAIKILALDGLNDAKLCTLIEQLLQTVYGVDSASINYFSQKLTLQISKRDVESATAEVIEILQQNVPGVSIKLMGVAREAPKMSARAAKREMEFMPDRQREPDPEDDEEDDEEYEDDELTEDPTPSEPSTLTLLLRKGLGAQLLGLGLAAVLLLCTLAFSLTGIFASVLLFVAYSAALYSAITFKPNHMPEEYQAATIITALSVSLLFLIGGRREAVAAILIYQISTLVLSGLYDRFFAQIAQAVPITPEKITCKQNGVIDEVPFDNVASGDHIVVEAGEVIPFDGTVYEGESMTINPLLGVSTPAKAEIGGRVECGDINLQSQLVIEVLCAQDLSTVHRFTQTILNAPVNSTEVSHSTRQSMIIFTLIEFAVTLGIGIITYGHTDMNDWLYNLLVFFTLANPCVMSAAVFAAQRNGLVSALKSGILIRSAKNMEKIQNCKTAIVGYTGVMTKGICTVSGIETSEEVAEEDLLEAAAYAEHNIEHPIADAILKCHKEMLGREVIPSRAGLSEGVPGLGVRSVVKRRITLIGSAKFMQEAGVDIPANTSESLCAYVTSFGGYSGRILLNDPLKPGAKALVRSLKDAGIDKAALLTGCDSTVAYAAGNLLGFDAVYSEKSGADKPRAIMRLMDHEPHLLFAGRVDDIELIGSLCPGIAMGSEMLPLMFELTDAVIPDGSLDKLAEAIRISKTARNLVWLNIGIFFLIKAALFAFTVIKGLSFTLAALSNALLTLIIAAIAVNAIRKKGFMPDADA